MLCAMRQIWCEQAQDLDDDFRPRSDPWDYARNAVDAERFRLCLEMLDEACGSRLFGRACEIGCAEGFFTERLAPRCESVLSLDGSELALSRARRRLCHCGNVHFAKFDLRRDGLADDNFDLILAMDVLPYLRHPLQFRAARDTIVRSLKPGGYLLVTTFGHRWLEDSWWWCRWLPRGRQIHWAFEKRLLRCQQRGTETHLLTLFRRPASATVRTRVPG